MLKLSDLASRPDFRLGPLSISPARRRVEGPAGTVHVEPLIMQVLLLLLDARGQVVTRQLLFDQVWGGVMVGDDSLNRAIARVRRIAAGTAPGLFEIETIPRTGYRLTGELLSSDQIAGEAQAREGPSRRTMVMGGAAVALAGGLGLWFLDSRKDRQFSALMDRGEQALLSADPAIDAGQYFERAIALRPDDASAQGLLAYSHAYKAEFSSGDDVSAALREAERAAGIALALDRNEPNARLAGIVLKRSTLDFATNEDQLREILAIAPRNIFAMRHLWALLQCVGRSRDSLAVIERAIALEPLAAISHYPLAQLLWILGRNAEADRVIDRAMHFWPSHRFVRFARFTIFAYTGRPRAALAMLESKEPAPPIYSPEAIALWRVSLAALDQRTPASIAAARSANLEAAKRDPRLSNQAILVLGALGVTDAAFEIANALFVVPGSRHSGMPDRGTAWRFAPWLFTPPTAALRADPRFAPLCDAVGLTDYWAKRGVRPDYQVDRV